MGIIRKSFLGILECVPFEIMDTSTVGAYGLDIIGGEVVIHRVGIIRISKVPLSPCPFRTQAMIQVQNIQLLMLMEVENPPHIPTFNVSSMHRRSSGVQGIFRGIEYEMG